MRTKILGTVLGLVILAGCGGGAEEATASAGDSASESTAAETASDASEATSGGDVESSGDSEEGASEAEVAETRTTTTAPEPEPTISEDDAIDAYNQYLELAVDYVEANLVHGDGTFDDAREVVERIDPALLGGDLEAVVIDFHNCSAEGATESRVFFQIESIEIEPEHLAQHRINADTIALEVRQFSRISGFPEQSTDITVLVTANGVGPTVATTGESDNCELPRSAEAEALVLEAEEVLGLGGTVSSSGELRSAEEVLAEEAAANSAQGTVGEPVQLREGLVVIVQSMGTEVAGSDKWFAVNARIENTGAESVVPDFQIFCAGSTSPGGQVFNGTETLSPWSALPAGTFAEGVVNLLAPDECTTPAVMRVIEQTGSATVDFPIPDEAIAALS